MNTRMRKIVSIVAGTVLSCLAAAASAGPPLSEYTIYAENGVVIGVDSEIVGLVGARNNDPNASNSAVKINANATVDGDVRSGGNVNLQNGASITGTVFRPAGTSLTLNAGSTVGTDAFPVDPELPTLPAPTAYTCPTGGAPDGGGNGESRTLTPGSFGAFTFGAAFELTLDGAGDYFFDSIHTGNNAKLVVTTPGTRVFVCGAMVFGSVEVTTSTSDPCDFSVEVHASGDNAFLAGGASTWIGDVFAPFGEIHIGAGSTVSSFVGRFWSNDLVDVEHAVAGNSVNCEDGPDDEQEFQTGKDATILHNRKHQNNGAPLTLRVAYQVRALVGFDVSNVDFSKVTSAKLVLTVSNNGYDIAPYSPSSGWPVGGGINAARLFDGFESWVEGNGNNFPTSNNPRGTGSGVTWQCATDTNIANEKADCSGAFKWKQGGRFVQGPLRGPALLTDGIPDGTKIEIDVTPDVQAGFGTSDDQFMTWFLDRKGSGSVAFYSREGAAAAGNAAFAPMLVIED